MVGIGHLLDTHIFGEAGVLRTAIIFFYISNEGLSLVENAAYLGLPIPGKLHTVLEQLHDRSEKEDDGKDGITSKDADTNQDALDQYCPEISESAGYCEEIVEPICYYTKVKHFSLNFDL